MKKNIISMLAAVAVVATVFTGCKKGEEDPGLSLSSRKARVAGTWNLTSTTETLKEVTTVPGAPTVTEQTTGSYDGTRIIYTTTVTPNPNNDPADKDTSTYTLSYTFEKDGTYTSERVETRTNYNTGKVETTTSKSTGTWDFNNGVGEFAKKEVLYLKELTEEYSFAVAGSAPVVTKYTYDNPIQTSWILVRLAKDEIKAYTLSNFTREEQNGAKTVIEGRDDYVFTAAE